MDETWRSDLDAWLAPFLSVFRHKVRARMCPAYVAGLIGAGDRKSVQPIAARDGQVGYDQLHHFIASGVWDAAPLEKALLATGVRHEFCLYTNTALILLRKRRSPTFSTERSQCRAPSAYRYSKTS